ncbi:MAG: sulfite exporter TauE/SafE family protein, partial [Phaeodactylibacter sp.]|nr:sulfite exporter TauE/SafE family protein [Phaeodactylibacter sp.]
VMVLVGRFSLLDANAMKIFVIAVYTIIALVLFQINGLVDWKTGSVLAIAQATGGYLTANFASKDKRANLWAHRLLVVVVLIAVLKLFLYP